MGDFGNIQNLVKSLPPWIILGSGFLFGYLKSFWTFFYDHTIGWFSNKCKVELVIEEQDHLEAFVWINLWMEKNLRKKKVSKLRLQRKTDQTDKEREEKAFELLPSYGFYWMWWKYKLLTFYSEKKESAGGGDYSNKKLIRTITLELWGTRDRQKLIDIVLEAKKDYEVRYEEQLKFYAHDADYWGTYSMVPRSLDTVYLPENQLKDIIKDIEMFFSSKDKYRKMGIPWRRTLMFDGPPGSGKSTVVQALSSHFRIPIYYLNAGKISEGVARELLHGVQTPCIILMEDIDSLNAAKKRTNADNKKKDVSASIKEDSSIGLKPTELLNLLDGVIATEQRLVIMTTNHPELLDPAILRPGRTDRKFHIGYAEEAELKRFHARATEYYNVPVYEDFRKLLPEKCTIADAQGLVLQLNSDLT